jgi:hypothetical protein
MVKFASLLVFGAVIALAGCADNRTTLIQSCQKDGSSRAACECFADLAKANLDEQSYDVMVKFYSIDDGAPNAEAQQARFDEAAAKLNPEQEQAMSGLILTAAFECGS